MNKSNNRKKQGNNNLFGADKNTVMKYTIVDVLQYRAKNQKDDIVYIYLSDGENESGKLTFGQLHEMAQRTALLLQRKNLSGERALLLYQPGIEFIIAFWGCLYAGTIAIPAYPPLPNRSLDRLEAIVADSKAKAILSCKLIAPYIQKRFEENPELANMDLMATDEIQGMALPDWERPAIINNDFIAFLQYTSGSTGHPKGVMVSHGNIMHNSELIRYHSHTSADSVSVTWLPSFHDMGLIDGIIQPVYGGFLSVVMSPVSFLQRPIRWLRAITRYKATRSGGPNFAYELCINKITPEERAGLDLSSWSTAYNGAEPIRKDTLVKFASKYKEYGFQSKYFAPCYGLAEATLLVTATIGREPVFMDIRADMYEKNLIMETDEYASNVKRLVGSGNLFPDIKLLIVNPETLVRCKTNEVGEIWISSKSVAKGYWNKPELTDQTFNAFLPDTHEGPFLRTGDLGFFKEDNLFITGRLKDVIIIRGRNHYPQDIELTVEKCNPALRSGCNAAFSVDVREEECLVVVQEVDGKYYDKLDGAAVINEIRKNISSEHDLQVQAVLLIKPGTIPKTSSGKIQRRATKEKFLNKQLEVLYEWNRKSTDLAYPPNSSEKKFLHDKTVKEIQEWLTGNIAKTMNVSQDEIDFDAPFDSFGMDSVKAVSISAELEDWLGCKLSPTLVYDYPSINLMSRFLCTVAADVTPGLRDKREHKLKSEPVAIVGMACRFPGAKNLAEFWDLLSEGRDAISEIPSERWDVDKYYDPEPGVPGKMYTKWGGFIDDIDKFDPRFFSISPREAESMDPQQRLLMEKSWEALENAGISQKMLTKSRTGVFMGISSFDYSIMQFSDMQNINAYSGTGGALSIGSNRLSYFMDLNGPSMSIDTACSSSLVAVHYACESLESGNCNLAIAGGVNLILTPHLNIIFSQAGMMARDGRCKTFDEKADGYVRGEGCGVVVLKRLSDAIKDNNTIYSIINGSSINQDGKTNGLTAPNGPSQQAVIEQALRKAGIQSSEISYVEAHGTGTSLGDPIEMNSLKKALLRERPGDRKCFVGSVKTNIGHLEAAAGIASLIKCALSIYHKKIPPHLHFRELNREINLDDTPVTIPTELTDWVTVDGNCHAGVSAFGFGGTNAHIILSGFENGNAGKKTTGAGQNNDYLLVVSAKNEASLKRYSKELSMFLKKLKFDVSGIGNNQLLSDITYTFQVGRNPMDHRISAIVSSIDELVEKLDNYSAGNPDINNFYSGNSKKNKLQRLVAGSAEKKELIDDLLKEKNLVRLAQLWISGEDIDWKLLYGLNTPKLIPLPAYPFNRESYWLRPPAEGLKYYVNDSNRNEDTRDEKFGINKLKPVPDGGSSLNIFEKCWRETGTYCHDEEKITGTVIIMTNDDTRFIADQLFNESGSVNKFIINNTKYSHVQTDQVYDTDLSKWDLGLKASRELFKAKKIIAGIIDLSDLWNYGRDTYSQIDGKMGFMREIIKNTGPAKFRMVHFTKGLGSFKCESPSLAGSNFAGFAGSVSAEYKKVASKTVDIDIDFKNADDLIEIILAEFYCAEANAQICYRKGARYSPYLKKITYPEGISEDKHPASVIKRDCVYVITGGTRGIGAEVVKHFVKQGAMKLVIMGSKDIPSPETWKDMMSDPATDEETRRKIKLFEELKKNGVKIALYAGLLTDEERMNKFFNLIRKKFGKIAGVIHCAGSVDKDDSAFINKKYENIKKVLEPKIKGLTVLHNVIKGDDPDFFVLFSSISAVIPDLATGLLDYALANSFMDSFAAYQYKKGYSFYKSINWASWKEVGMGEVKSPAYTSLGLKSLSTRNGLLLLDKIISSKNSTQLVACNITDSFDPEAAFRVNRKNERPHSDIDKKPRYNIASDADVYDSILQWIRGIMSAALKIPEKELDIDTDFGDFGVDSVLLAQMVKQIERQINVNLDPTVFFENNSLSKLADFFGQNFKKEIIENIFNAGRKISAPDADFIHESGPVSQNAPEKKSVLSASDSRSSDNRIAVIGIGCHFPGAGDYNQFWENLESGKDCIVEVPKSRWNIDEFYNPKGGYGRCISKWGGFIDDIELFDPVYFNLKEEDAYHLDPLVRQFLEVCAQTIQDAGYDRKELWNKTAGVFVGSRMSTYAERIRFPRKNSIIGIGQNFISAHISHYFNFKGPSMVLDTACSSSLVSINLACNSLLSGESELALAGGVDILLDEKPYLILSESNALSPDGKCHTFDESANGFVPGEGCGAVLLKKLDKAIRDGDHIYAVIEATAVNNDGHTMGITTPNPDAQMMVVREALRRGNIDPESITYIETHGTGTMIGDPIELKSLTKVYREFTDKAQFCGVGSVKTNIGHLLSSAGIASFIKVVLSLYNKKIPPTLNCVNPNPRFKFSTSPFYPVNAARYWVPALGIRRSGISSFGFGGTNAHIILSEFNGKNFNNYSPARKSLPPIVFNKKPYWIEKENSGGSINTNRRLDGNRPDILKTNLPVDDGNSMLEFEEIIN